VKNKLLSQPKLALSSFERVLLSNELIVFNRNFESSVILEKDSVEGHIIAPRKYGLWDGKWRMCIQDSLKVVLKTDRAELQRA
jgi:hypothetical protein